MLFSIYENNNLRISAGLDPFAIGFSTNVSYSWGSGAVGYGIGWGVMSNMNINLGVSQAIDGATISAGVGAGNNYFGWNISIADRVKGWEASYGQTYYGTGFGPDLQSNRQTVGSVSLFFPNGSFKLQNDFLRFNEQDRWRTNAWELSIGKFSIGSSVYTNDPKNQYGEDDFSVPGYSPTWGPNTDGFGEWNNGQVYSAPLWLGYRYGNGNQIARFGYSHPAIQDVTQNAIHRYLPIGRQHYYTRYDYFQRGFYGYSGYNNPFSLY